MIKQFTDGKNILLTYGGGRIKKSGLYDKVKTLLEGYKVFDLEGIEPNPRLSTVKRGVELVQSHQIDFILAIGGGSVITNWETNEKLGWGSPLAFPKFSLLNPELIFTLPVNQTVNGIVDSMSHLLEQYFNEAAHTAVGDAMIAGTMKEIMKAGRVALADPENYEARETLMIGATVALNGFMRLGYNGDWATHNLEHAVSAVHDIAHGAGFAILFPAWMTYVSKKSPERFEKFAEDVFNVDNSLSSGEKIKAGIEGLSSYWTSIGVPSQLSEFDIPAEDIDVFTEKHYLMDHSVISFSCRKQMLKRSISLHYKFIPRHAIVVDFL